MANAQLFTNEKAFVSLEGNLREIEALADGWDSYGAPAPNAEVVRSTRCLLDVLRAASLIPKHLVPSAEGGIAAYFILGERTAYIEYQNSGGGILAMYNREGEPDVREFGDDAAERTEAIGLIRKYIAS